MLTLNFAPDSKCHQSIIIEALTFVPAPLERSIYRQPDSDSTTTMLTWKFAPKVNLNQRPLKCHVLGGYFWLRSSTLWLWFSLVSRVTIRIPSPSFMADNLLTAENAGQQVTIPILIKSGLNCNIAAYPTMALT